jgi:hypothetical protein
VLIAHGRTNRYEVANFAPKASTASWREVKRRERRERRGQTLSARALFLSKNAPFPTLAIKLRLGRPAKRRTDEAL